MVVTGQPYLEATADALRSVETMTAGQTIRKGWLRQSGQGADAAVVLFASDPVARDMGPGTEHYRGYDEYDTLRGLVQALDDVRPALARAAVLVLKPHPSQSQAEVTSLQRQPGAEDALLTTEAPWPSIAAADVVVGMTSMMLLEAALAGKPAISFQPSASAPEFVGTRIGAVPAAASIEMLTDLLTTTLASPSSAGAVPPALDMRGAARRVAGLVTQLAAAHGAPAATRRRA